jgi:hypothetical protein
LRYLLGLLAELAVEVGMIVCIHAALECLRISRPIKEPRRDAQRADAVTGSPSRKDFVGLAIMPSAQRRKDANASALAELGQNLHCQSLPSRPTSNVNWPGYRGPACPLLGVFLPSIRRGGEGHGWNLGQEALARFCWNAIK